MRDFVFQSLKLFINLVCCFLVCLLALRRLGIFVVIHSGLANDLATLSFLTFAASGLGLVSEIALTRSSQVGSLALNVFFVLKLELLKCGIPACLSSLNVAL